MKNRYILFFFTILGFIFILFVFEGILRIKYGKPSIFADPHPQFNYQYIEIYKKFFKKTRLPDGKIFYMPQRSWETKKDIFPVIKDKNTKRIFILGGSVAQGLQDNQYILKNILEEITPNIKFEIINCGMRGYDSYRELLVLKEIIHYSPDLIILFSGNNEFYTPIFINPLKYKLNRLLSNFLLFQFIQKKILKSYDRPPKQITPQERLINFENNLKKMIYITKKKNIPFAICTLPTNFSNCAFNKPAPWSNRKFFLAYQLWEQRDYNKAKEEFISFIKKYPFEPFGYYYLAKCYEALKNYDKAIKIYLSSMDVAFWAGIDNDRCYPIKNRIIRNLCKKEDIILIDLEKAFIDNAPNGLVGKEMFFDNCHWYTKYNILVFKEIIKSIINYNMNHSNWIFGISYTPFYIKENFNKILNIQEKKDIDLILFSTFKRIINTYNNYNLYIINERLISFLEAIYQINPYILYDISKLKEDILQKYNESEKDDIFLKILDEDKFNSCWNIFLIHIAEILRRNGVYDKAIEYFQKIIEFNPEFYFPYLGIAISKYKLGLIEEAKEYFNKAEEKARDYPLVRYWREYLGI